MSLQLTCPACAASFSLPAEMRGKKTICPKCSDPLVITSAGVAKRDEGTNFNLYAEDEGSGATRRSENRRPAPVSASPVPVPRVSGPHLSAPPDLASAPIPEPGRKRRWLLPLLMLLLLFVGVALYFLTRPSKKEPEASREGASRPAKEFRNTIGMKFVWIEPGDFLMGSPDGKTPPGMPAEEERYKDETPHRVTLTKGYYLGVYLVTQDQWETVMGKDANHSFFKGKDEDEKKKLPVENMTWFDCVEFCINLSKKENRKPHYRLTDMERNGDGWIKAAKVEMLAGGTGYRLPTEAEWEYACRAGTRTPFWWGATITTDQANYNGNYTYGKDGKKGEYREKTTPVDRFKANPWGLHDIHGNLWQWCQDWLGPYDDGKGGNWGDARMVRGGAWNRRPSRCRSASRANAPEGYPYSYIGCRLLLCQE